MTLIKNGFILGGSLPIWFFSLMFITSSCAFLANKHENDMEFHRAFIVLRNGYHCLMAFLLILVLYWANKGA